MLKHCFACGADKEIADFFRNRATKDGLQSCCKSCSREKCRKWAKNNRDKCRGYVNKYAANNRASISSTAQKRYRKDIEASRAYARESYNRRKEKVAAYSYEFRRRPASIIYRRVTRQIAYLVGSCHGLRAFDLIGYSVTDLMRHLEKQFVGGMSWENIRQWHIDHITPIDAFGITGPNDEKLKLAWSLSNLRPLWAKENMNKGSKRVLLV